MKTLVKMNFDPDIAKDVGTDAAIIFENIAYWIDKNRANEKSFHDGNWWTYNSHRAFLIQFTWLTSKKIRTCLDKLKEKGYVVTGNYNSTAYDRTVWYALGGNSICLKRQMDSPEGANQFAQNGEPIPNGNTDYKRERAHSPTTEEKRQTYDQIVELCADHIGAIAEKLGLYPSEVEGCALDMASYYAGNGKYLDNPPARLIKWCRDEIKAGKLEVA